MPEINRAKANNMEDQQQDKRIQDLENLYSMLPQVEPDIIEVHYEQFHKNADQTYEYLSRGKHLNQGRTAATRGLIVTRGTDDDDAALNDLIMGSPMIPAPRMRAPVVSDEQLQILASDLPPEEKMMINNALTKEKRKKKAETAKKKGWCGCFA